MEIEISREKLNTIKVGNGESGFVTSQSVEANLLFAILNKLDEVKNAICELRHDIRRFS